MKSGLSFKKCVLLLFVVVFPALSSDKLLFQQKAFELGAEPSVASMQDRDGFLWFGSTASGLLRYDGYEVKRFKPGENSVNNGWVNAIFEDSKGILWIGTNGGGLNRYDKNDNSFTYYTHDPKNENSISSNTFLMFSPLIIEDSQNPGVLWLGTQGGLNRFDTESETFMRFMSDSTDSNSLSHDEIYSIQQDSDGILWIGTKAGLNRFDPQNKKISRYLYAKNDPEVWSVLADNSQIWVGTGKGELLSFDKVNKSFAKVHTFGVTILGLDRIDNNRLALYGGAASGGFTIYDIDSKTAVNYQNEPDNSASLSGKGVRSLVKDSQGILWAVTNSGSVDKVDPGAMKFKPYKADPSNPKTIPIETCIPRYVQKDGTAWMGSLGGLMKYDPATKEFSSFSNDPKDSLSLPQNYATSIYEDNDSTLWIGTFTGGLVSWDRKNNRVIKKEDISAIYKMIEDPFDRDILWGATYLNGFVKYNKRTGEQEIYKNDPKNPRSISSNITVSFVQDVEDSNTLWLAMTGSGLDKFNKKEGSFEHFVHTAEDSSSIPGNMIWNITLDSENRIWLGTAQGLGRFDPKSGKSKNFTEKNGYPLTNTHWIMEDAHKNLWLGTDAGLVVFDMASEKIEKIYTAADGIAGMPFFATAYAKAPDGTFWVGGFKGLNVFHPDSLRDNEYLPPVHLTSLTQGGEPLALNSAVERTTEISLNWQHNYFEFEYSALNFTLPEKNQYQYMLEGWEDQWYDAGTNRKARYSGLRPGTYTLRVRGSNNDGRWSDSEVALKVTVLSPPWKTPVAYALYGILFAGILAGYVLAQRRKRDELERLVKQRTAELQDAKNHAEEANRAKSDFIANMSHEIRTPMNAVLGFTEILREQITDLQQAKYLQTIQTSGTALLHLINDILDLSKIESGKMELNYSPTSMTMLVNEMHTIFYQKMDTKGLEFRLHVDETVPLALLIDEGRLRQVLINMIGNAVKFTDQGYVELSAKAEPDSGTSRVKLELSVTDTGIGVPPDQQEKIFGAFEQVKGQSLKLYGGTGLGLAISNRLITLMGGEIALTSEPGVGATFTVTIPDVEITNEESLAVSEEQFRSESVLFKPATILIADDVDYNREMLSTFLKDWNFSLLTASNGKEAVELAEQHKPDLILMDMKMPVMNGYEAAETIHGNPKLAHIPIIAVTASTLKGDEAALSAISDSFIRKPVTKRELVKTILPFLSHELKEPEHIEDNEESEEIHFPFQERIEELLILAESGYLDQIKSAVDELADSDETFRPFAREVKRYCGQFDDDGLVQFLQG